MRNSTFSSPLRAGICIQTGQANFQKLNQAISETLGKFKALSVSGQRSCGPTSSNSRWPFIVSRLEGIFFVPKCIYFVHLTKLSRSTLSALCLSLSTEKFLILWEWNCKAKMTGKKRQGQAVELQSCVSPLVKVTVSSKQRPIKLWNKLLGQTGRLAIPGPQSSPESTNTEQGLWAELATSTEMPWCPLMFLQTSQEPTSSLPETLETRKAQISNLTFFYNSSNYCSAISMHRFNSHFLGYTQFSLCISPATLYLSSLNL